MRISYLTYIFSLMLRYFSFVFLIPAIVALIFQEQTYYIFIVAGIITFALGLLLKMVPNTKKITTINDIKKSEGLFVVVLFWLFAGVFSTIPYLYFDVSPLNALFEATSGITATGATIMTDYNLPHSLLFWRSFTQWLGGMGIIVLFIAVLPQFAIAGRQLFYAEAPCTTEDKLTPRIKNTAIALWKIYFGMTLLEIILLKINGVSYYDAICCAFSTVSGGGFFPGKESCMNYSTIILLIITFFMFFAGASYNLQYIVWTKLNPLLFFKNEEFKIYFAIFVTITCLLTGSLCFYSDYGILESIKHSLFQVAAIISTTGFCSVDFAGWDYTSKAVLFLGMLVGSCAGSAGGGIKISRILLFFKVMRAEMAKILHPKSVYTVKLGKYTVSKDVLYQILMFIFFYIMILVVSGFMIALIEHNTVIGFTSAVSSLGNIGPALSNPVGPVGNYENLNSISKGIMIFDMYIGRLELIPFLVLLKKEIWNFK